MSDWPQTSGGVTLPINLVTDVTGILPSANIDSAIARLTDLTPYALLSGNLSQFAATTSLQLKNTISDETGSGALVFATSPSLVTPLLGTPTSGTLTNCTGYIEANIVITDITTNNASTTAHGFLKKLSNSATDFMDGTGAWDTIKDSDLSTTDITTNNVSTTKHGFTPKLPNDATKYLDGTGAYTVPAGAGGGITGTLTSGRVTFATGASTVSDDADFTFATDTLTITKVIVGTSINIGPLVSVGSGVVAIGGNVNSALYVRISGSPAVGINNGLTIDPTLSGDLNSQPCILSVGGTVNEFSSGTHALITTLRLDPPTINAGSATVTTDATLYIAGPPAASGATHYSQYIFAGNVRWGGYGAGALSTDANGNITATSDERLKDIIGRYTKGLSSILAIKPIKFNWKASSRLDTITEYTGFSAQEVQEILPEAVGIMNDVPHYLTINDRVLVATLINAIHELNNRLVALE